MDEYRGFYVHGTGDGLEGWFGAGTGCGHWSGDGYGNGSGEGYEASYRGNGYGEMSKSGVGWITNVTRYREDL